MAKQKSDAFDLRASQLKGTHADITTYEELAGWLSRELDNGLEARGTVAEDIRYGWALYQQERTRGRNAPWPDAADLTSPMACEYVDALHARAMQTIFVEPVFTVEGWGESAKRAPFVEEFHQRMVEDERLQGVLDEVLLRSWIEPAGILEIAEGAEYRRERKTIRGKLVLDQATGLAIQGEDDQPVIEQDEAGQFIEAAGEQEPSAEMDIDSWEPVRVGPDYDVIPYLDFLTLPSHARNRSQIWGYAKKFHRRVPELKARALRGIYDTKAVEACGTENERDTQTNEAPNVTVVNEQRGPTAQKELWEVQFLADLDSKGERWYRATVHKDKRILLRLKQDDRTTRYIRFVPFPKPGSVDGYSLVTHKMITVIEEDTAVRNMRADKAALAVASPILKQQGALWDEYEQPFSPRAVITVRDPKEITQLTLNDVPNSIIQWHQDVRADADRLVGQNDTSLGTNTSEDRTLGEVRLRAGYAEVRVDLIIKRLKESMEELFQARHTIWKRTLAGQSQGMPMPQSMAMGLEARGVEFSSINDGRITADMLEGQFWGKPRGSTETADLGRQRQDFNGLLQTIPGMLQMMPALAAIFQTPQAAKSFLEQILRVYRWPDKQAFLGSEAQSSVKAQFEAQQQQAQEQQMMQSPQMRIAMALAEHGGAPIPGGMPMGGGEQPQQGAMLQ